MLHAIARLAIAAPRRVIAAALLVMVATAIFGVPVIKALSAGGELDPGSESAKASALLSRKFGQGDTGILITVTSRGGAQGPQARAVGTELVARLQDSPHVGQVQSPWTVPPGAAPSFVSEDGKTGLITAAISGNETDAQNTAKQLADKLVHDSDGVSVRAGGDATVNWQVNEQTQQDLFRMESLALPLSFVVLVWVFGGLVAAESVGRERFHRPEKSEQTPPPRHERRPARGERLQHPATRAQNFHRGNFSRVRDETEHHPKRRNAQ